MINSNDLTTARRCSKLYNDNLKHKEILFLFQDKDSREFNYVEVKFKPENFQHLTGILVKDKTKCGGANDFLNLMSSNRLNEEDCFYKADGTTKLKLMILPSIMNIGKTARMIGDYDSSRINIVADKVCGGQAMTLAILKDNTGDYVPCSVLRDDVRRMTNKPNSIRAAYIRTYKNELGKDILEPYCLLSKSKVFDEKVLPQTIIDHLTCK